MNNITINHHVVLPKVTEKLINIALISACLTENKTNAFLLDVRFLSGDQLMIARSVNGFELLDSLGKPFGLIDSMDLSAITSIQLVKDADEYLKWINQTENFGFSYHCDQEKMAA